MKRWVIELPEDTPPQLTCNMTELTEDYIWENFEGISRVGTELGRLEAWEAIKKLVEDLEDDHFRSGEYVTAFCSESLSAVMNNYSPPAVISKVNELEKNRSWYRTCPICEYDIDRCQCLFGGSAHPDRSMRERAVKDHLQYLSKEQLKHIIYLERNWNTSGIGEYQEAVDELKEKAQFVETEGDDE